MAEKRRIYKIAERLQSVIASELLRMSDPRFNMVTITSVVVTNDMRNAKVYFSVIGDKTVRQEADEAFISANGPLKSTVARELNLRFVPHLRFYYDDTLEVQEQVFSLMEKIKEK